MGTLSQGTKVGKAEGAPRGEGRGIVSKRRGELDPRTKKGGRDDSSCSPSPVFLIQPGKNWR